MSPRKALVKTRDPGYLMDTRTNTVINTNTKDLATYRSRVQDFQELDRVKKDMNDLMKQVEEIKRALLQK